MEKENNLERSVPVFVAFYIFGIVIPISIVIGVVTFTLRKSKVVKVTFVANVPMQTKLHLYMSHYRSLFSPLKPIKDISNLINSLHWKSRHRSFPDLNQPSEEKCTISSHPKHLTSLSWSS